MIVYVVQVPALVSNNQYDLGIKSKSQIYTKSELRIFMYTSPSFLYCSWVGPRTL